MPENSRRKIFFLKRKRRRLRFFFFFKPLNSLWRNFSKNLNLFPVVPAAPLLMLLLLLLPPPPKKMRRKISFSLSHPLKTGKRISRRDSPSRRLLIFPFSRLIRLDPKGSRSRDHEWTALYPSLSLSFSLTTTLKNVFIFLFLFFFS